MNKDESGDMFIPAADAYGDYNDEAVQVVPIDQFEGIELKEGLTLYGQGEDGQTAQVTVKSFTDTDVSIDFNHPMAGKDLMFSVTVKDAREATADEIATGVVGGEAPASGGSCGTGCGCH
jgi:FKBP-type peptidyl-prolyl cis-trans isomerase SlyD